MLTEVGRRLVPFRGASEEQFGRVLTMSAVTCHAVSMGFIGTPHLTGVAPGKWQQSRGLTGLHYWVFVKAARPPFPKLCAKFRG